MNSIKYEDRFKGLLPEAVFPLPIPGRIVKRSEPPCVVQKALNMARDFLEGRRYSERKFPLNARSKLTETVLVALYAEIETAHIERREAKRTGIGAFVEYVNLRRMIAHIEAWDIPMMVVEDYRMSFCSMWSAEKSGWKNPYERPYHLEEFCGFTNLYHKKTFQSRTDLLIECGVT